MAQTEEPGTAAALPWWLQGTEYCGHCHGEYIYEQEYRCVRCDGPVCMTCVVLVRRRVYCPHCAPRRRE